MTVLTFNRSLTSIVGKELHTDLTELRNGLPKSLPWEAATSERFEKLSRIARTAQLRTVHKVISAIAESSKLLTSSSGNDSILESTTKLLQSLIAHLNEMVQDHKNTPLKMAKSLHSLLTLLGHTPSPVLSAELFMPFNPEDVTGDRPGVVQPNEFAAAIRDYRSAYQNGVIKLLKEHDTSQYSALRQALVSIEPKNPHAGYRVFFEGSIAVLDILIKQNDKEIDNLAKWILSKIDPELNNISKGSIAANDDLISCMMHFIARADNEVSVRVRKLQEHFNLKSYLADLNGVAPELIEKFTQVLVRSREVWSQHASTEPSRVAKLISELQTKSAMLKNPGFTIVINALDEVITAIAEHKEEVNGEQLSLEGAGALLILEQQLKDGSNVNSANISANRLYQLIGKNTDVTNTVNEHQTATAILHVLAAQIQEDLGQLEPRLLEVLNNQLDGEQEFRNGLKKISKILNIFGKGNPLSLCFSFFESNLSYPESIEDKTEVATRFTQLGTIIESLKTSDKNALSAAQKWLDGQAKVETPVEGDEFKDVPNDSEMLEIFLEEASGIIIDLEKWLAQLKNDPSMHDTVVNMRRGYHTLKGSGRMVGLVRFGDLSYIGELLLNNWITSKKIPTPELLDYYKKSLDAVTLHINSFKSKGYSFIDYSEFEQKAAALGGTSLSEAPQSKRSTIKLGGHNSTTKKVENEKPVVKEVIKEPLQELPEFTIPNDIQNDVDSSLSLSTTVEPEKENLSFDSLNTTTSGAPLVPELPPLNFESAPEPLSFKEEPLTFAPVAEVKKEINVLPEPVVIETATSLPELKFAEPAELPVMEPVKLETKQEPAKIEPVEVKKEVRKTPDAWQKKKTEQKSDPKPVVKQEVKKEEPIKPEPKKVPVKVEEPKPEKKGFFGWLLSLFGKK